LTHHLYYLVIDRAVQAEASASSRRAIAAAAAHQAAQRRAEEVAAVEAQASDVCCSLTRMSSG